MNFLASIFGSTVIAGYLRAAAASLVASLAIKYLPGSDSVALGAAAGTLVSGVWSHMAKTADPSAKTVLTPRAAETAIIANKAGAAPMAVTRADNSQE